MAKKIKITDKNKYNENIDTSEQLETYNAIIENNDVICPICKSKNDLTSIIADKYDLVTLNGDNVVLFTCKCNKCKVFVQYCSDIRLNGTTRLSAEGFKRIKNE